MILRRRVASHGASHNDQRRLLMQEPFSPRQLPEDQASRIVPSLKLRRKVRAGLSILMAGVKRASAVC